MKVFVAIPSYKGLSCPAFIDSLIATHKMLTERGHEVSLGMRIGCCWVQFSRIGLLHQFDESEADILWFADDDLGWNAEDAVRLIEAEEEVVAGAYLRRGGKDGDFVVGIDTDEGGYPIGKVSPVRIQCTFAPTGFMRIKRSALEKMKVAYPEKVFTQPTGEVCHDLFPQGVHGGQWYGEDSAFCKLWHDIGGKIWIIPDITLSHWQQVPRNGWIDKILAKIGLRRSPLWSAVVGNYHDFLMRQPGGCKA